MKSVLRALVCALAFVGLTQLAGAAEAPPPGPDPAARNEPISAVPCYEDMSIRVVATGADADAAASPTARVHRPDRK